MNNWKHNACHLPKIGRRWALFCRDERRIASSLVVQAARHHMRLLDLPRYGTVLTTLRSLDGFGAEMRSLALPAKETENFDWLRVSAAEPVRDSRIELRRLTRCDHEIVISKHKAELATQDEEPFISLVRLSVRRAWRASSRNDELVGLYSPGSTSKRHHGHPITDDGPRIDAWVASGRCANELVDLNAVSLGQWQK